MEARRGRSRRGGRTRGREPERKGEPGVAGQERRKLREKRPELRREKGADATSAPALLADLEFILKSNKKGLAWSKEASKPPFKGAPGVASSLGHLASRTFLIQCPPPQSGKEPLEHADSAGALCEVWRVVSISGSLWRRQGTSLVRSRYRHSGQN